MLCDYALYKSTFTLHYIQNVNHEDLTLQLGSTIIEPARVVRDLGVLLDDELSMKQHISKVASTCFYQLRRLHQLTRPRSNSAVSLSIYHVALRLL